METTGMTSIEKIHEHLKLAPDWIVREVADYIEYPETKGVPSSPRKRLDDFHGVLKDWPSFEGDPAGAAR